MNTVVAITVTLNRSVAMELSAPFAVTVMVATPAATGVIVAFDPDMLTVATPVADEDAGVGRCVPERVPDGYHGGARAHMQRPSRQRSHRRHPGAATDGAGRRGVRTATTSVVKSSTVP